MRPSFRFCFLFGAVSATEELLVVRENHPAQPSRVLSADMAQYTIRWNTYHDHVMPENIRFAMRPLSRMPIYVRQVLSNVLEERG